MQSLISVISKRCENVTPVVIAMSGGVDSCLVAAAARQALKGPVFGVTVRSELNAAHEFTRAVEVAEFIGLEHHPCVFVSWRTNTSGAIRTSAAITANA